MRSWVPSLDQNREEEAGRWKGRRERGLKREKCKDNVVQDHSDGEKDQKHSLLMAEGKLDAALCVQQKQARLQR